MPADRKKLKELVARINRTSNADFVRRLLDEKRKVLKNDDGTVSTHELGYVTEDGGAVVFPSVQSVGDSLARFPYPESYERAVERGDTVHMSIPDAELFTVGYKDYYPGFDRYSYGGSIHIKPSHRGRLTELKERTGKTEAELYSDGNPAHKKMVVFARNARKWNHADGGFLTDYPDSGTIIPVMPGNYTGDTDFVKRYAGGGDMAQMMGAVGPEYMSSLANSATAYPAIETVNVNPSQEDETQVWQIPQYGHVPEYSQPAAVPPAVEPAPAEESVFNPAAVQAEYDSMLDNILLRQRYAESGFNDRAVNKSSGAAGAYQIMPIAYKDYLQRGRGKEGDLMNAAYNRLVRDHVVRMAPKDLGKEFYTDHDTALERHAKEMAVFNAGGGTVRKALRKAVNAGMDITSSFDWLQFLPKETRDYVNFIVLGQEIENSGKNEEAYQAALTKFNNRHDLGGLVSRINKAYGGDRKKMSDVFGRIKAANKFDDGGDNDGDKYVEETDPSFIGPVLPTYSGGNMNAAVASASLPSIQTAHGKRIAHNMAKRVVAGQMQMGQVPRSYRSYVEGEAKGAIPMTDFMNTAGKYAAAGTAATIAAPWLLSLAATAPAAISTELGTYGNIYGNLARTMLMDVPAFEAADRIPTLWGGNRLTVQGGDLAERGYRAVMPESRFTDATAPFVNQAGQFVTGMPVGMAGHGLMQAGTQAADAAKRYADGLLDRGAEIVLRTGDDAQSLTGNLAEQFGSKKTWRYLLDPKADPNLAYQLPWGYSGETTDLHDAHYGDMIDKFLRKVPIQGASYDQSELPQFLRDYIAKNYPGKKIPIVHLGEARSRFRFDNNDASTRLMLENMPVGSSIIPPEGVSSASVKIPDRTINNGSIVDPGGFRMVVTRTPDGFLLDNWDIWKFLPDDYAPRYMKNNTTLQRLRNKYGLKFLDSRGTPIVHHWTENLPTMELY